MSRYPTMTSRSRPGGRGWIYRVAVQPPGVDDRLVTIEFRLRHPHVPVVFADGPSSSPHRYEDGSLCMWFPADPPSHRWAFSDGLVALVGQAQVHLIKEHLWRQWGEWPGDEVAHDVDVVPRAA